MFQNHPSIKIMKYVQYQYKKDVEEWFQFKCKKHVFKQTWHIKLLHLLTEIIFSIKAYHILPYNWYLFYNYTTQDYFEMLNGHIISIHKITFLSIYTLAN